MDNGNPNSIDGSTTTPSYPIWSSGLHFLIVDDTVTNRKMLKKLLTSAGHRVSEAVDGVDCLEQLDYLRGEETVSVQGVWGSQSRVVSETETQSVCRLAEDVDIVLMDEHMPRMEGPECCAMLRERGFVKPIIAVTGTVQEDARQGFVKAGAVAVLQKPMNMELLRQTVEKCLILEEASTM